MGSVLLFTQPVIDAFDPRLLVAPPLDFTRMLWYMNFIGWSKIIFSFTNLSLCYTWILLLAWYCFWKPIDNVSMWLIILFLLFCLGSLIEFQLSTCIKNKFVSNKNTRQEFCCIFFKLQLLIRLPSGHQCNIFCSQGHSGCLWLEHSC